MNSPDKVLHRLIHTDKGAYFLNVPPSEMELFNPRIVTHIANCQDKKCKEMFKRASTF